MGQPPTKRLGPLMLLATNRKLRRWAVAFGGMLLLLVLYALSSGPAQMLSFSVRIATTDSGARVLVFDAGWWPQVYRPIWWAVQQPWGGPIKSYLSLFPYSRRGPPVLTPLPTDHPASGVAPADSDL